MLDHYRTKIAIWLDKPRRIGWQYGAVRLAYIGAVTDGTPDEPRLL